MLVYTFPYLDFLFHLFNYLLIIIVKLFYILYNTFSFLIWQALHYAVF